MADRKISDLTALTTPASGDYLPIVDISEASAANKNKRITIEELLRGAPDGTAGAPGIGFESDPNTGIYSPGADQLALSTNGTGRLFVDANGVITIGASSTGFYISPLTGSSAYLATDSASTAADFVFGTSTSIPIRFITNNTERLRITSTGQLSHIGAGSTGSPAVSFNGSAPSNSLVITSAGLVGIGTSEPNGLKLGFGLSASQKNGIDYVVSSPYSYTDIWGAGLTGGWAGQIRFWTSNNATPSTPSMTLNESGRLGIGTTSPSSLLHLADAGDITVGTTTGTKIGTATTQKLGFYNATPVVQPAAVADATDAATVITQLNDLLAKLRTLGIIAT